MTLRAKGVRRTNSLVTSDAFVGLACDAFKSIVETHAVNPTNSKQPQAVPEIPTPEEGRPVIAVRSFGVTDKGKIRPTTSSSDYPQSPPGPGMADRGVPARLEGQRVKPGQSGNHALVIPPALLHGRYLITRNRAMPVNPNDSSAPEWFGLRASLTC